MAPRHRTQVETHQGLMADILRLTRRHGEGDDGVNAGLPGADGDDDAERGEQKADGRVETAAVLKNTLLEAMSYEDLLREHVQHLAFGGTCLALQLSRQNAVERLIEIVGPENPIDARRVAPASIRARLGSDLIRNAVHAASNLAEASHCISAVFGYTTQYSAADIRTNTTVPESAGANLDERSAGGPRAVRPCSELVVVPLHNDHFSPLTTADLRLANVNAQAHLSYYTERPLRSPSAAESAEEKTAVHHHGAGEVGDESVSCAAQSWKRHAEDLEGELAAERLVLASHANLLRVRELDLLLREHELEDMTRGFLAAPEPVARGTQSLSGTALRSNGPAVVAAEDVTALLAKPVRLQALFFAVQQEATDGAVKHEDIIALYDRSPAVQLVGMDNHRERFQNYLYEHIQEPVSFDSFVATLMFLFKQ